MPRSKKTARTTAHEKASGDIVLPAQCRLAQLPLEILSEILLHTASPRDILAVSRCSKFFCATLVNNTPTAYIWKRLRAKFDNIPDPTPNWTEASYAAFLFDEPICAVCKHKYPGQAFSYMLRLNLCGTKLPPAKNDCRNTYLRDHILRLSSQSVDKRYRCLLQWVPRAESCLTHSIVGQGVRIVRKDDWNEAKDALNKATLEDRLDDFVAEGEAKAKNIVALDELCNKLQMWKNRRDKEAKEVKAANDQLAKALAKREGWQYWDMKMSPSFALLQRCKKTSHELITDQDLKFITPDIEAEIIHTHSARDRRRQETAYASARAAVAKRYKKLLSPDTILPPLEDFRRLHSLQIVANQPNTVSMLQDSKLDVPIKEELNQWAHDATEGLGKVLGFPNWKSASATKVHVARRVNTIYMCSKCKKFGRGSRWEDPGLNFHEVCSHSCPHLSKKQRAQTVWCAENFIPDTHAMDALTQVLRSAGIDWSKPSAKADLQGLQDRIVCRACPTPVVMTCVGVIGHSRRHEKPHFEVVSSDEVKAITHGHPSQAGLALMYRQSLGMGKIDREKWIFVCRHCTHVTAPSQIAPAASTSDLAIGDDDPQCSGPPASDEPADASMADTAVEGVPAADADTGSNGPAPPAVLDTTCANPGPSEREKMSMKKAKSLYWQARREKVKANKRYTFNGLQSHAKASHGIAWIADEDFYVDPE